MSKTQDKNKRVPGRKPSNIEIKAEKQKAKALFELKKNKLQVVNDRLFEKAKDTFRQTNMMIENDDSSGT